MLTEEQRHRIERQKQEALQRRRMRQQHTSEAALHARILAAGTDSDQGSHTSVDPARIQRLNQLCARPSARYVLYWVQQDVRALCNHALEYSASRANQLGLPLLAVYGLTAIFPGANERMFHFLLDGLRDLKLALGSRGVELTVLLSDPPQAVARLAQDAAVVVCDRCYSRICREWRRRVAADCNCEVVQVETNVVVPVELASNRLEPASRTLRPKIRAHLDRFLQPVKQVTILHQSSNRALAVPLEGAAVLSIGSTSEMLGQLSEEGMSSSVPPVAGFDGGESAALKHLAVFLGEQQSNLAPPVALTAQGGIWNYGNGKANDPANPQTSGLSPFIHFGHISTLHVALAVRAVTGDCSGSGSSSSAQGATAAQAYLEELIIRRELARNMCYFNPDQYDCFGCIPCWARESLEAHIEDERSVTYTKEQLSRGETSDMCWNAAQWEMVATGHMHNYLRMYWCKRIIEWCPDPATAFEIALELNNQFELDGRDENAYMGVAWCFGHHDQPFPERPIFGSVRSMSPKGLESKFDMMGYRTRVYRKCLEAVKLEPRLMELLPKITLVAPKPSNGGGKKRPLPAAVAGDIRAFLKKKH